MAVTIVYATDKNNCLQARVSMESVMANFAQDNSVTFYLLHDNTVNEIDKCTVASVATSYSNCEIKFINTLDTFDEICENIQMESVPSTATYFRLLMSEYLKEDSCLYLDTDIIVCEDLSPLFELDMKDKYVFGAKDILMQVNLSRGLGTEMMAAQLGRTDFSEYINAGVLLMNLKRMREDNIAPILMSHIKEKYFFQDQDIINKVFHGHIGFLDAKYNYMQNRHEAYSSYELDVKELEEMILNPVILHFSGPWYEKSWTSSIAECVTEWWKYYNLVVNKKELSALYGEQLLDRFGAAIEKDKRNDILRVIRQNKPVYIYGAGQYGRKVWNLYFRNNTLFQGFIETTRSKSDDTFVFEEVREKVVETGACIVVAVSKKYTGEIEKVLRESKIFNYVVIDDFSMIS